MKEEPLRYEVLEECKCGPEEFFVLVSSVDYECKNELEMFLKVLVDLVAEGLLRCSQGQRKNVHPTLDELRSYVESRISRGEDLEELPSSWSAEYSFTTTDEGIKCLREEDRPVRREGPTGL